MSGITLSALAVYVVFTTIAIKGSVRYVCYLGLYLGPYLGPYLIYVAIKGSVRYVCYLRPSSAAVSPLSVPAALTSPLPLFSPRPAAHP